MPKSNRLRLFMWLTIPAVLVGIGCLGVHYGMSSYQQTNLSKRIEDAGGASMQGKARDIYGRTVIGKIGLRGSSISDQACAALIPVTQIETLDLANTSAASETMRRLSAAHHLEILVLDNTEIRDDDMRYLADVPIRELSLNNTNVTDAGLAEVAACKSLSIVHARGTHITAQGAEALKSSLGHPQIEWSSAVSEDVRQAVARMARRGTLIDVAPEPFAADIRRGKKDGAVYTITITSEWHSWSKENHEDLKMISLNELVDIQLRGENPRNVEAIRAIPRIRRLSFDSWALRDESLALLDTIGELRCLALVSPNITDKGLTFVGRQRRLEDLFIDTQSITDSGISELRGLQKLVSLTIRGNAFTDQLLKEIRDFHPSLQNLKLQCPNVSPIAVDRLQSERPSLKVVIESPE